MEFPREPKAMTSKRQIRSDSKRPTASLPPDYSALLVDVKNRIRTAQIRAILSVNRELIQLYRDIGRLIVERQRAQGWGRSVVERFAADIQKGFPGMSGFSPQNIWKMRGFFLAWTAEVRNRSQAVRESRRDKFLAQLAREIGRASAARRRGNSLGAQHGVDLQAEGSCPATMVRPSSDCQRLVEIDARTLDRIRRVLSPG
jgi:hypothetical protein